MRRRIVEVTWLDPTIDAGWHEDDPDKPLRELKTYGILVRKGKQITIAGSYDPEHKRWADVTRFPKGCVISIRVIETVNM